jgi:hypothetical protein
LFVVPVIAGLVPAISIHQTQVMRDCDVYMLASRPGGTIYVGVPNNLSRRLHEHRKGQIGFPSAGPVFDVLIKSVNPAWNDLSDNLF